MDKRLLGASRRVAARFTVEVRAPNGRIAASQIGVRQRFV
jgi:hypothetical protein